MKKILFVLAVVLGTVSVKAQKQLEKMAHKVTDKMTTVLSLSEEESTKVYEYQMAKFKALKTAKNENKEDKKAMKAAKKKVVLDTQNKLKAYLGADRFKKWAQWNAEHKKKA